MLNPKKEKPMPDTPIIDARMELGNEFWKANYMRLLKQVKPDSGAYLLNPDGTTRLVGFGKLKLQELYKLMDCRCVDVVRLPTPDNRELVMIIDDEGLLADEAEINPTASAITNCLYAGRGTPICGAVVIADDAQFA
jgi:hypothetical protein